MRGETHMILLIYGIGLTAMTVFFGAAVASIRGASRTRLLEVLNGDEGEERTDRFFRLRRAYARSALIGQHASILLGAALLIEVCSEMTTPGMRWSIAIIGGLLWLLVFAVGIPVGWARYAGDRFLGTTLTVLEIIRRGLLPLLLVVNVVDELVRRLAGAPRERSDKSEQIELEIMDAVSQGEISGMMNPAEKEIIKSALELDEKSVAEIMTPRTDIIGIEAGAGYEDVREALLTEGHSRLPVYEDSLDHIVGMLYAKDLLRASDPAALNIREIMRQVVFVPETKDLSSLLKEFQRDRVHIAVVLDEYGGTAGLVTLEDIVEELIGDIADEHEAPPPPQIEHIDERTVDVDARVRVEDLNESLHIELPVEEAYDTVAGYVFSRLGCVPSPGDATTEGGVRIEVLEAGDRRIRRLRVHLPEAVASGE